MTLSIFNFILLYVISISPINNYPIRTTGYPKNLSFDLSRSHELNPFPTKRQAGPSSISSFVRFPKKSHNKVHWVLNCIEYLIYPTELKKEFQIDETCLAQISIGTGSYQPIPECKTYAIKSFLREFQNCNVSLNTASDISLEMFEIAEQLQKERNFSQACQTFETALKTLPFHKGIISASALTSLAWLQVQEGNYLAAEKNLDSALKIFPDYWDAWMKIGDASRCQRNFWKALKAYEIANELNPDTNLQLDKLITKLKEILKGAENNLEVFQKYFNETRKVSLKLPTGVTVSPNSYEQGGCYISYIIEGSPADKTQIMQGDQLISTGKHLLVGLPFQDCLERIKQSFMEAEYSKRIEISTYRGQLCYLYGTKGLKKSVQRIDYPM